MPQIDLDSDLLNYLARSDFEAGDRLPTINELQDKDHLDISISKVREQLEVARAMGLVEVRSKTGMRLKEYSFGPAVRLSLFYALATNPHLFEQFTVLRNHIEAGFWHEACALLTDEDKAEMRRCIERAQVKLNNSPIHIPTEEHRVFHLTVFKRLDNPFVIGLLEAYWDAYEAVGITRYVDYTHLKSVWDYHQRILDAIYAGDLDLAQSLFIEHTRLLRYEPRLNGVPPPAST
jgi:DNA-binding FadR family transcriptional regulator